MAPQTEALAGTLPRLAADVERLPTQAAAADGIAFAIHDDLAAAEVAWRGFEKVAEHTVFQTFGWLSAWMRNVGVLSGVRPAIVIGRGPDGAVLFLMPLAVESRWSVRRLYWLGSELADYNAPMLAPGFSSAVNPPRFRELWREITRSLMRDRRFRHDTVVLEKMPESVGSQRNPFLVLPVALNASGAYAAELFGDWESYYFEKRSSATRRHDRSKRKKLGELGEVRFVTPECGNDIRRTIAALIEQKAKQFARMGVANMFAKPGHAEFYADLATDPATRGMVHVSRLDVGEIIAAANFGAVHGGRYYHIVAAYHDGDVARCGPGAMHLREILRYAIERGCTVFDFTSGDEPYKREWADSTIRLYDLHSAATPGGWIVAGGGFAGSRVKRFIKQTPVLWRAFTRTRAFGGWLKRREEIPPEGGPPGA